LAVEIMLNYSFNILNLHQVHCFIGEENKASVELFQKLRFESCGIIKDWLYHSNTWENVLFFQRINELEK
jgi:diamine N-acetyltransferase